MPNVRRAYSYYPIYDLKLLQLAGYSVCLVVTRHFFLVSSSLSSIMSSKAMQLEASCGCKLMAVGKLRLDCCCCTTWVGDGSGAGIRAQTARGEPREAWLRHRIPRSRDGGSAEPSREHVTFFQRNSKDRKSVSMGERISEV
jgi:hypothetical protein